MTQHLAKFTFPATNQDIRIVDNDGNPWWVLKDVCEILSISNSRDAASRLDDDEKGVAQIDTLGGSQNVTIINEPGLYSVILRSDKPEAKAFRRWVTHEVIPQIRKTGSYGVDPMKALADPASLRSLLLTYTEKVQTLEAVVAEQAPKVQALLRLEGAEGSLCMTDAAKALNVKPKTFIAYLQTNKWIYKRPFTTTWVGYQDKIQSGVVETSEYLQTKPDGTEKVRTQVRVTAKGLARLASAFEAVSTN